MRYHEIMGEAVERHIETQKDLPLVQIEEYVKGSSSFTVDDYDFENYKQLGHISTKSGQFQVISIQDQDHLAFAAVKYKEDRTLDYKNPICVLVFVILADRILLHKNAVTQPSYQGNGIATELFGYINQAEKFQILSDPVLTPEGEKLWKSLSNSSYFNCKIFNFATRETFELSDVGIKKSAEGELVKHPEQDCLSHEFYHPVSHTIGQKYFFLLEAKLERIIEGNMVHGINFDGQRRKSPIVVGNIKFTDAIE